MVVETMDADDAGLILWEPGTPRPRLINVTNTNARLIANVEESLMAEGRESFERLEAEGLGHVSVCEDTALARDIPRERTTDIGVRALLEVPIFLEGQLFAILDAVYTRPRRFTEEEQRLFGSLARRAALAIENARLYEQAQSLAAVEERQRLARELHDSVSQALYGIALGARTARTLLDRDPAKAKDPVDYVLTLAEAGLAEMRALIFELRPESLANEGIVAAIEKQVASTRARYGVDVVTDLPEEPDVTLPVKEAIYRVAQEALHNVVKHARATRVDLRLVADDGHLSLDLKDDGLGFDPNGDFPGHLGLRSMRERVTRLGGDFAIESAPGAGTHIRARVPC
jgi:signal transduction histidine kinase